MGEGKRRDKRLADMIAQDPWCIYCDAPAETVEHMPPRAMFEPFRPKGMEFPCCNPCNQATKLADQVASWVSFLRMNDAGAPTAKFKKLLGGLANNAPELLKEWHIPPAKMKFDLMRSGLSSSHGAIRTNGPFMTYYMETFGAKFGFSIHYEKTGQRVGRHGAVAVRWFSNDSLLQGDFSPEAFGIFHGPETLRQGKQEVSHHFAYKWLTDGTITGVLGAFGEAFAVLAIASSDIERLTGIIGEGASVIRPGDFRKRTVPRPVEWHSAVSSCDRHPRTIDRPFAFGREIGPHTPTPTGRFTCVRFFNADLWTMRENDSIEIRIGRWFQASAKGLGVFMLPVALVIVAGAIWVWTNR